MYTIYTDGACSGNNSRSRCLGGYGYVILDDEGRAFAEFGGSELGTTNNRMEMKAVVESLNYLNSYIKSNNGIAKEIKCSIVTDSKYVCDNWNDYFKKWKSSGWRKSDGSQVLNIDLWKAIDEATSGFESVVFKWVKGHATNPYNNKADLIAVNHINALRRHLACLE